MEKEVIYQRITDILRSVIGASNLTLSDSILMEDIEGWDSLTYLTFVKEVEKAFSIQLSVRETLFWENIRDIVEGVYDKTN